MYEFKVKLNDDDYIAFNQYHLLHSPTGKKTLISCRLILPVLSFLYIVIFIAAGSDFQLILFQVILMSILSIFWLVFSTKIYFKAMRRGINKMKKEGRLPYDKESILKFDDENYYDITPNTENKTNYSMIEKIAVTEKAIYIYVSSMQASIIPVATFSDEIEKQKFLEFISLKAKK